MRPPYLQLLIVLCWLCSAVAVPAVAQEAPERLSPGLGPKHALAMHGEPALGPDFTHFAYVNPDAPKGGTLVLSDVGTFDTLNPYLPLGRPMWYMAFPRRVFDTLMVRNRDEPFTMYGLLAETVEVPDDRSWIAFTLRQEARFSDGTPVTVDDVVFSYEMLRDHGRHRGRYKKILRVDRPGPRSVRFVFDPELGDRELPLIIGGMPVFSKRYFEGRDFSKTTLKPPIGTGPYVVTEVDPGRSLTFTRNPDYWAKDLPVSHGFANFDVIRYDYYRDANAAFEAFKAGAVTMRLEPDSNALRWARGYEFGAVRDGQIKRDIFAPPRWLGMLGFAINTRRPQFADRRVREALVTAFDFDWLNTNYFFGAYTRAKSFFPLSDLAASGPATAEERALLVDYPDALPEEAMTQGVRFITGGSYYPRLRDKLARALTLFREAGYDIRDTVMTHQETGAPFRFEIMIEHPDHQRVALNYAADLKKIGVEVSVRLVDSSQFQTRQRAFDFDMMPFLWRRSLSPGAEQNFRWGSESAERPGTFNLSGAQNPAIDFLIRRLVSSREREELVAAARALDRVLLANHYVVPMYHSTGDRVAWWAHLRHPERPSLTGYDVDSWWQDPAGPDGTTP